MKPVWPAVFRAFRLVSWRRIGWLAGGAILLTALLWPGEFGGGPTYDGWTAIEWLDQVESIDGLGYPRTVEAFRAMGRAGVRFLAQYLQMPVRERLGKAIFRNYQPQGKLRDVLGKVLEPSDGMQQRREHAANILSMMGPDAEPAMPELLAVFRRGDNDDSVTWVVCDTFKSLGEKMAFLAPELIQGLNRTNVDREVACAKILGTIGPKARSALPALLNATNANTWLAQSAALAIWDIDRRTNVVVEALGRALQSHAVNRGSFLNILQRRGLFPKASAPVLQKALFDPDGVVRGEAEKMLQTIDPERLQATIDQLNKNAPLILQQSIAVLENGPNQIPSQAFIVIQFFGPQAASAVPALTGILNQAPQLVASFSGFQRITWRELLRASMAIGSIGPAARESVPALTNILSRGGDSAEIYCNAVGGIGPDALKAIPDLEALFNGTEKGVRLRRYGGSSSPFQPIANDPVRLAAARALVKIAPDSATNAVVFLKEAAVGRQPLAVAESGIRGRYNSRGRETVVEWLTFRQSLAAQATLWEAGLVAHSPVTNLMYLLSEVNDPNAKHLAIQLLAEIGPESRPALPLLESFLKPGGNLRWDAAIAVQRIDPQEAAKLGLPGLLLAY